MVDISGVIDSSVFLSPHHLQLLDQPVKFLIEDRRSRNVADSARPSHLEELSVNLLNVQNDVFRQRIAPMPECLCNRLLQCGHVAFSKKEIQVKDILRP